MKIAIVGCGAMGSVYAGLFASAVLDGRSAWEAAMRGRDSEAEKRAASSPQNIADRVRAREAR